MRDTLLYPQKITMTKRWLRIIGLLLLGLALGLGLGLYLGWEAWPTEFTDAAPEILQDQYRRDYVLLIATTYAADGDLAAARRRVASLGENGGDYLFGVTLDAILRAEDETAVTHLTRLALDLGYDSPAFDPYRMNNNDPTTTP